MNPSQLALLQTPTHAVYTQLTVVTSERARALSSQRDLVSGNSSAASRCVILGTSISLSLSFIIFQIRIMCYEYYPSWGLV